MNLIDGKPCAKKRSFTMWFAVFWRLKDGKLQSR